MLERVFRVEGEGEGGRGRDVSNDKTMKKNPRKSDPPGLSQRGRRPDGQGNLINYTRIPWYPGVLDSIFVPVNYMTDQLFLYRDLSKGCGSLVSANRRNITDRREFAEEQGTGQLI